MKILILYGKIGNGHFKAAEAIKEAIEKEYIDAQIIMEDGLEAYNEKSLTNKIIIGGYQNLTKYIPEVWGNIYYLSDKPNKSALKEIYDVMSKSNIIRLKKMFRKIQPDIIISTHPFTSKMAAYLKKKNKTSAPIFSIVTDYDLHTIWIDGKDNIDKIFVATDNMKKECINYGVDENKIEVTGIPVSQKFSYHEYSREVTLKNMGLDINKKTFLFFAGGELGLGDSKGILTSLAQSNQDMQLIVVSGKNAKQKTKFEELTQKSNICVRVLGYVDNVSELMNASDVVITKPGGLTSTECLVMNKPMIIVNPIPGQEEENAIYLTNSGVAFRVYDNDRIEDVLDIIKYYDIRCEQMKVMCSRLAKPEAAINIAKIAYELVKGED